MKTIVLKDRSGNPAWVLVDFKDWTNIANAIGIPPIDEKTGNLAEDFEFVKLQDFTFSLLSCLSEQTGGLKLAEFGAPNVKDKSLSQKVDLSSEVTALMCDTATFASRERMQEVVTKYGQVLLMLSSHDHH